MPAARVPAHYISGTHWDREWYRPFEEFRFLLVQLIDGLIGLMERDAGFRHFHLDGQTCMLEDYVAIRPERRDRLARLIREGRILVGPWYTMPDLFCVGDEALIRNLALGRQIARSWGRRADAGRLRLRHVRPSLADAADLRRIRLPRRGPRTRGQ